MCIRDRYWISTDVVSVVLKDCGYDLMELVYDDMSKHIDAYPMNIKGSKNPDKKTDFRVVYFQQKFFQRNALELSLIHIYMDLLSVCFLPQWLLLFLQEVLYGYLHP